jgi:putative ABC transport system permease protein
MDFVRTLFSRITAFFRSSELDKDLDDELLAHIDLAVQENLKRGMTAQQARAAALRDFGGVVQIKESYRSQRGLPFLETLSRDLRYAFRQLRKSPGFTLTSILTLAIGIGVNTAIFSMMDAIVLRPLAVPDLNRVVTVAEEHGSGDYRQVALANYESWLQQSHSFENLAVRNYASVSLTGAGDAAHVEAEYTSANFFDVMRAQPLLGRVYLGSEGVAGHDGVAVLSYGFWKKHFAADSNVLGRRVELDDRSYTVIGVMPKTVQYPSTADVFLPLAPTPQQLENRLAQDYLVIGRLKPGVTLDGARAELRVIAERLAKAYPASNLGWSIRTEPLLDGVNGSMTPLYMRLVMVATIFVLLVVCANVANLQFVRGIARRPEIAVRTALGAGRGHLLRHLLTENILLGILGAAGGLLLASICLHLCIIAMPEQVARYVAGWSNISLNGRAFAFSILLALAAGLVSGLLPALKALRVNIVEQLKAGSRTASGSRQTHRLRDLFAVAQISLSVLLVIGAALMCKGMWSMLHMADAYRPKQTLTFSVYLPPVRYGNDVKMAAWFESSLERLRAMPGVTHAEITTSLPDGQDEWMDDFRIENRPLMPGKFQSAARLAVSSGYFLAMHIPILSGRYFNSSDASGSQPSTVVSRKFAERYFPGENPIGHRIQMRTGDNSHDPWVRIVGVSGDVNYLWIHRETEPAVYLNVAQMPPAQAVYMIATEGDPLSLVAGARRALAGIDAAVPLDEVETYQQSMNNALAGLSYVAAWLTVDAMVGLLLAAIGIFGVMANMVAERTREIGLRMALGASPGTMLGMILRRAALLTASGVTAGILMAAGMARLSANLLFGVSPYDPAIFCSIALSVTAIALLVCWGPARRAASVDPMLALRAE